MTALTRCTVSSPVGPITLVASPTGLRAVVWGGDDTDEADVVDATPGRTPILDEAARQLDDYFAGRRLDFDLPLEPAGTDFQLAVWRVLRGIPYGRTISYGEQARRLGDPKKARAVGGANGRNPLGIVVPCHRVIGADGSLTGFASGVESKKWLLEHERTVLARQEVSRS